MKIYATLLASDATSATLQLAFPGGILRNVRLRHGFSINIAPSDKPLVQIVTPPPSALLERPRVDDDRPPVTSALRLLPYLDV